MFVLPDLETDCSGRFSAGVYLKQTESHVPTWQSSRAVIILQTNLKLRSNILYLIESLRMTTVTFPRGAIYEISKHV